MCAISTKPCRACMPRNAHPCPAVRLGDVIAYANPGDGACRRSQFRHRRSDTAPSPLAGSDRSPPARTATAPRSHYEGVSLSPPKRWIDRADSQVRGDLLPLQVSNHPALEMKYAATTISGASRAKPSVAAARHVEKPLTSERPTPAMTKHQTSTTTVSKASKAELTRA